MALNYNFDYQGYKTERQKRSEELGLSTALTEKEYNALENAPAIGKSYSSTIQALLNNKQALYDNGFDEDTINSLETKALSSADPEAAEADMLSAIAFARNLDIPVSDAYRNLDALMEAQFFNNVPRGKTAPKAIADSFALGELSVQRGRIGYDLMFLDPESEEYKKKYAQVLELNKEIEYRQDYIPRSWYTYILKSAGNTVAYSLSNMAESFKNNAITQMGLTGLASVAGLNTAGSALAGTAIAGVGTVAMPLTAVIATAGLAAGIAGGYMNGLQIEGGNQYIALIESGIDHKTASNISLLHGAISSAIEQTLEGVVGGVTNSALRAVGLNVDTLASRMITKGILDGTLSRRLATIGTIWAKDVLSEGLEEAFQGLSADLTKNLAFVLNDMNAPVSASDAVKNMFSEAVGGMAGSLLLGLAGAVGDANISIQTAADLKRLASESYSKTDFEEKAKSILPDALTDEDTNKVIDTLWAEGKTVRDRHWNRVSDVLENSAVITERPTYDAEGNMIGVSWDDENEIFQLDDASFAKSEDKQNHTIRFGNIEQRGYNQQVAEIHQKKEEGEQLFGDEHDFKVGQRMQIVQGVQIDFTTDNDNLTINDIKLAEGLDESVKSKAVKRLIELFPDYSVSWNAKTAEDVSLRDSLISQNPRGSQYGLNYRENVDTESTNYVKRWLGNRFSEDDTENSIMAMSVEAMAQKYGMNGKQFLENYTEEIQSIKGNKKAEALIAANGQRIEDVKGFTSAIKDARDNVKAVIYAGEHADLSTFQHEMHHLVMAIGDNKKEFTEAFDKAKGTSIFRRFVSKNLDIIGSVRGEDGRLDEKKLQAIIEEIDSGEWKRDANEFETELFNAWQREGRSLNSELKPIMQRIAESIRKVFSVLKRDGSGVQLNDEISAYYEKLLGAESDGKDRSSWKFSPDSTITPLSRESAESNVLLQLREENDEFKKVEARLKADSSNFDVEGNHLAPNGKKSNLTYRQWIQVRTDSFKNWFGDWEKAYSFNRIMEEDPVAILTGNEFAKQENKSLVDSVNEFYSSFGNKVHRDGFGQVLLRKHDIQSSIAHGVGRIKAIAFKAVPEVIQNGEIFAETDNYKSRGYTSVVIAAPIKIGTDEYICEVVVNKEESQNNFYLHEVELKNKLQLGNQVRSYGNESQRNTKTGASKLIIAKLLAEGKFGSSKVVDENGEPMVMYHGTEAKSITVFNDENYQNRNAGDKSFIFFSPFLENAEEYAGESDNIYQCFLNMRNPLDSYNLKNKEDRFYEQYASWLDSYYREKNKGYSEDAIDKYVESRIESDINDVYKRANADEPVHWAIQDGFLKNLRENGYDGFIDRHVFGDSEYAVLSSNQVKSATDNNGNFSNDNPNILFQAFPNEFTSVDEAQKALDEVIEAEGAPVIKEDSVRINVSTVPELYALAEGAKAEFSETIKKLQNIFGLSDDRVHSRTSLKKSNRVVEKAVNDYGRDVGRVIDVNGSTFSFDNYANAEDSYNKALDYLGDAVVKKKAFISKSGYKDFKINFKTSNGFIGELILIDENIAWMKDNGIGHDIYEVLRKYEPYVKEENGNSEKYKALFGEQIWNAIDKIFKDLNEWSKKAYDNAKAIRNGQYDKPGFKANLYAVSSDITELSSQLRSNIDASYLVGLSSYTLPSESTLNMVTGPIESSLLNALSQMSKYVTDIETTSNQNVSQNTSEVKDLQGIKKNVVFQTKVSDAFKEELDAISEADIGKPNDTIVFSDETPVVFRELGLENLSVEMYKDKLARALYLSESERHGHSNGLSKEIIQQVAEKFADPLMVFLSKNEKDLVAVYEVLDKNGNTVMASIKANAGTSEWNIVNLITSTYGRENRQYANWINEQRLKYVDDTKKEALTVRLQLPSALTSNQNILRKTDIVNKYQCDKVLFQIISDADKDELYDLARDSENFADFKGIVSAMMDGEFEEGDLLNIYAEVKDLYDEDEKEESYDDIDYDALRKEEDVPDNEEVEDVDPFDDIADKKLEIYPTNPLENVSDSDIENMQKSMIASFQAEKGEAEMPRETYTLAKPDATLNNIKDKNKSFDRIISTDEGILEFINGLREGVDDTRDGINLEDYYDKDDEFGAWSINEKTNFKYDLEEKAAPLVKGLAYKTDFGFGVKNHLPLKLSDIDAKALKSLRGIVRNNMDFYRNLYAEAKADEYWSGLPTLEEIYGLDEKLSNTNGLSISEIKKMAAAINDNKLRDRIIRGGKVDVNELREYLVRAKEREEAAKNEYDLALAVKEQKLQAQSGELRRVSVEATKAEEAYEKAKTALEETDSLLEAKVNELARKARKEGLDAKDIQEQQKLAQKKEYLERLTKQRQKVVKNLWNDKSQYYGRLGEKKKAEIDEKIKKVVSAIDEMSEREVITEKEAVEKLIELATLIGKEKTEKAVYEAVTLERWKAKNRENEKAAKEEENRVNEEYLRKKKSKEQKEEAEEKLYNAVTYERWMAAKKAIEKAEKEDEKRANEEYLRKKQKKEDAEEAKEKLYDTVTLERWKAAKRRNEVERIYQKKVDDLKAEYKSRETAQKLKDRMLKQARMIMRPPSAQMDLEEAAKLQEIQAAYDPNFRSTMRVLVSNDGEEPAYETKKISELKAIYRKDPNDSRLDNLSEAQKAKLALTSMDEMTLSELEELRRITDDLRNIGRAKRSAYIQEKKQNESNLRNSLIGQITKRKDYDPSANIGGSRERRKMLKKGYRDVFFSTLTMATKSKQIDNNKEGSFYNLLIEEKRKHQREEWSARYKREAPVDKLFKELDIDTSYLYQNYKDIQFTGLEGTRSYTLSDLAYIYLSANNQRNVEAVAYGTLVTKTEKSRFYMEANDLYPGDDTKNIVSRNEYVDMQIRALGDARYSELYAVARDTIEGDEKAMAVTKAIEEDLNEKERFELIKENVARRYNQPVEKVDYYLPINRNDSKGETPADKVANDLLNQHTKSGKPVIGRGFTITRLDIAPRHQPSTDIDLLKVWQNAVYNQEHMLAFGDYIDKLNAVFENKGQERDFLRESIIDCKNLGKSMYDDIVEYIDVVANPELTGKEGANPIDPLIRFAKGGIYSGYLGFKLSAVVTQLITSPAPFLGKVNVPRLFSSFLQITMDPNGVRDKINAISPFMRNRSFSMIYDEIKSAASEADKYSDGTWKAKTRKAYDQAMDIGMRGLEWIDWYCVSAGWKAIYDEEIIKLGGETEENVKKAVEIADKYTAETQPLTDPTEIAPYLTKGGEALKTFTQFRASLNVIWNNTVNDANAILHPKANPANFKEAVGRIVGYMGAGVLVALLRGEIGGDDEEDKKKRSWDIVRDLATAATSQFTDSVPILGDLASTGAAMILTGKYERSFGTDLFPFFSDTLDGIGRVTNYLSTPREDRDPEKLAKAFQAVVEGTALAVGLPVSAYKDTKRVFDNWDEGGWMALFGRRQFNKKQ